MARLNPILGPEVLRNTMAAGSEMTLGAATDSGLKEAGETKACPGNLAP